MCEMDEERRIMKGFRSYVGVLLRAADTCERITEQDVRKGSKDETSGT